MLMVLEGGWRREKRSRFVKIDEQVVVDVWGKREVV